MSAWRWIAGVGVGLALGCGAVWDRVAAPIPPEGGRMEAEVDTLRGDRAADEAVQAALVLALAAANGVPGDDRAILDRHVLARPWSHGWVVLTRRYRVPGDLTVAEASALAGADVGAGTVLAAPVMDAREGFAPLEALLVALTAPGFFERAAAATGMPAEALRAELRARGLDVEARTWDGTPWAGSPPPERHAPAVVVAGGSERPGRFDRVLALDEARRLDPAAKPGDRWFLPGVEDVVAALAGVAPREDLAFLESPGDGPETAHHLDVRHALLAPVPVPAALVGHVTEVHALYEGGAHGVLRVEVDGPREAEATWRALDAVAATTGYRPVLLGAAGRAAQDAPFGWEFLASAAEGHGEPNTIGLPGGRYAAADPAGVLARVDEVDPAELIGPRGTYGALEPEHGPWPLDARPSKGFEALGLGKSWIALVPTDAAWKVPAYLPWVLSAGEATPAPAALCAVARRWEQAWGARVAAIGPATLEMALARPPATQDDARALATEHFHFAPEAVSARTIEERAGMLLGAETLYAWWD